MPSINNFTENRRSFKSINFRRKLFFFFFFHSIHTIYIYISIVDGSRRWNNNHESRDKKGGVNEAGGGRTSERTIGFPIVQRAFVFSNIPSPRNRLSMWLPVAHSPLSLFPHSPPPPARRRMMDRRRLISYWALRRTSATVSCIRLIRFSRFSAVIARKGSCREERRPRRVMKNNNSSLRK